MAWTKFQAIIAVVLVITGSINTLSTKWADMMYSKGSDGKDRVFNHPFLQACSMFVGEFLCLLAFKAVYYHYWRKHDGSHDEMKLLKGSRSFNPFILLPPAMCDMFATSIMYVGLNLTYASSFQMLRGAVIVFVGILSIFFLNRRLKLYEWLGIALVIAGLAIVGVSDFIAPDSSSSQQGKSTEDIILGDALIIGAQLIAASQMVLEEKYVSGLDIPALQAVGWEGLFGFTVLGVLLVPFYYIHVPPPFSDNAHNSLEDAIDGFTQMGNNPMIILALTGTVLSIAFFNFAGISVTKEISATTRMVLDSVRTLFIYLFSLAVSWQKFHYLQPIGFVLLVAGMGLYNDLFSPIIARFRNREQSQDTESIVNHAADEP